MKKIPVYGLTLVCVFVFIISCQNDNQLHSEPGTTSQKTNKLTSPLSDSSILLDLSAMIEENRMPDELEVDIQYDHYFKSPKSYRGYSLNTLLAPYLQKLKIQGTTTSEAVITFICTDGYQPTLQVSELLAAEGYIVFCDENFSDNDQCWSDSLKSKFQPFYLVWKDVPFENNDLPWPYGLARIKINKTNSVYDEIYPYNKEEAIAGFNQYRNHCIKCHSINKIGGNVGPDFNYPKNITEYWKVEDMWEYAKNPQTFRYNARMNPITSLSREEFDEIIVYLKYIRSENLK